MAEPRRYHDLGGRFDTPGWGEVGPIRREERALFQWERQCAAVRVLLNDEMADLDLPVEITSAGRPVMTTRVRRTIDALARTLAERGDPRSMYGAEVAVELPAAP